MMTIVLEFSIFFVKSESTLPSMVVLWGWVGIY